MCTYKVIPTPDFSISPGIEQDTETHTHTHTHRTTKNSLVAGLGGWG